MCDEEEEINLHGVTWRTTTSIFSSEAVPKLVDFSPPGVADFNSKMISGSPGLMQP